jgi:Family of unknown function (DUF6441)
MATSLDDKASKEFFKSQLGDLSAATRAATRAAAKQLKEEMKKQVRQNFKRGRNSNGSFFNAFKVYNLDENERQGPASYVRSGVKFLDIFETGGEVTPKNGKYLITLTPGGEKIGFKRITKANTWDSVFNKYKKFLKIIQTNSGILVVYEFQGRSTIVYKFVKKIRLRKKIDFYAAAERIAEQVPDQINKLLK